MLRFGYFRVDPFIMKDKPKIILYNPLAEYFDMPLALLAIGSVPDPERFEVILIDGRIQRDPLALISTHLPSALCVGISVITGAPIPDALRVSAEVKKIRPAVPVIWGGWHPSLFPKELLSEHDCIDYTFQGPGELSFGKIVERLAAGADLKGIEGVSMREGPGILTWKPAPVSPPGVAGRINYALIPVEEYFKRKGRRQLDYMASAGCPNRCTFCAEPVLNGRQYAALIPQRIFEDLSYYYEKYAFEDVNFQDESFFSSSRRVSELAEKIAGSGMKFSWAATMRADQGSRMSDEQWTLCRQSGLRRLLIGVESGWQPRLDSLQKDISIPQVLHCAEMCKSLGIAANFPFIVGFPDESEDEFRAGIKLAVTLRRMSPLFETPMFFFKPYPHARLNHDCLPADYRLPSTTLEWGKFGFSISSGPWVSKRKMRYVNRMNFYLKAAYGHLRSVFLLPLRAISRWRVNHDCLIIPVEKSLYRLLKNR